MLFALASLMLPSMASADWIVIAAGVGDDGPVAEAATISESLEAMSALDAARAVDRALGVAPITASDEEVGELRAADEAILLAVADGRNDTALRLANEELERVVPRIAALGRRSQASQHIANICLYATRAALQSSEAEGDAMATRCVSLVPDLVPNRQLHPPTVLESIGRVRARLEQREPTLTIRGSVEGCAVRVNGRRVGETPQVALHAPDGNAVVQVECAQSPGRPTEVTVPAELELDVALQRAVRTDGGLRLRYPSVVTIREMSPGHVRSLTAMSGASRGVIVSQEGDSLVLTGTHSSARVAADDASAIERAVDALREGEDLIEERQAPARSLQPRATSGRTVAQKAVGWSLFGVGVGGLAAGWAYYVVWRDVDQSIQRDGRNDLKDQRSRRSLQSMLTGGGGALMLTVALPFILPDADGVPWGAWVGAALGAGVVATGVVLALGHNELNDEDQFVQRLPLGPLVAVHGLPLLALPLIYGIRSATQGRADVALQTREGGATLTITGRF